MRVTAADLPAPAERLFEVNGVVLGGLKGLKIAEVALVESVLPLLLEVLPRQHLAHVQSVPPPSSRLLSGCCF